MTVYLEYALADNFTMDFLLLFCAAITLKIPFKWWRIVLGAATGSAIALASVYVSGWLNYLVKAACLVAMCFVSVGWGKKLFWHILLTLAYTFVTGGAIVGIFNLLKLDYLTSNGFFYNTKVPLFVYILGVTACILLCYFIVQFVKQTKKVAPYLKKVILHLNSPCTVLGFCDSGNTVNVNGIPVCFVTKSFKGVKEYFAQQILLGNTQKVAVQTLTGQQQLLAVQATLNIDGTTHNIFLALPKTKTQTQYQLLLNGEFFGG